MAWYYHLYGTSLYAMTPVEEGYVYPRIYMQEISLSVCTSDYMQPDIRGNMSNLPRPSITKREDYLLPHIEALN